MARAIHQLPCRDGKLGHGGAEESGRHGKIDRRERPLGGAPQLGPIQPAGQAPLMLHHLLAEANILRNTEVRQQGEVLVDRLDAGGERLDWRQGGVHEPLNDDLAFVRRLCAGDDLDQGALAAAVLAEQMVDLPGLDRQAHAPEGMDAGEPLVQPAQFQERNGGGRARRQWGG